MLFSFLFYFIISIFYSRCNNADKCEISAESESFGGDPCPGVPKYLEVYFGCFPGKILFCFNLLSLVGSPRLILAFHFMCLSEAMLGIYLSFYLLNPGGLLRFLLILFSLPLASACERLFTAIQSFVMLKGSLTFLSTSLTWLLQVWWTKLVFTWCQPWTTVEGGSMSKDRKISRGSLWVSLFDWRHPCHPRLVRWHVLEMRWDKLAMTTRGTDSYSSCHRFDPQFALIALRWHDYLVGRISFQAKIWLNERIQSREMHKLDPNKWFSYKLIPF